MIFLPVTNAGARAFTINVGDAVFVMRTYFIAGQEDTWKLDVLDADNNPLAVGISLVPGADNLFKGLGDTLKGFQLYVFQEGATIGPESLGVELNLVLFMPSEENPFGPVDDRDAAIARLEWPQ